MGRFLWVPSALAAVLALAATPAGARSKPEAVLARASESARHESHFPHAFLLPKGIPDAAGSYNLQLGFFREQEGSASRFDGGTHVSAGMFDWGGFHLRNLGFRSSPTELIGMIAVVRDTARRQGISFIGILGLPTNPPPESTDEHGHESGVDAERELSYLFGLTGRAILFGRASLDAILHYDIREEHFIPEAGVVAHVWGGLFTTVDARATVGENGSAYVLPGIKYRLLKTGYGYGFLSNGFIGLGYQFPVAGDSAFDHQVYVQLELGRH